MKLADFPEVRALSTQEKLQLVDELWFSVAPELSSLAVSRQEKDLLDARWAAFLKAPLARNRLEEKRLAKRTEEVRKMESEK